MPLTTPIAASPQSKVFAERTTMVDDVPRVARVEHGVVPGSPRDGRVLLENLSDALEGA